MLGMYQKKRRDLMSILVLVWVMIPIVIYTSCAPLSLVTAIRNSHTERVRELIAKGDIKNINENITWAVTFPQIENEPVEVTTCPLLMAIQKGYKEIVDILLEAGANPDGTDLASVTPLYAATFEAGFLFRFTKKRGIHKYDEKIIHSLLDRGANVNKKINGTLLFITDKGPNEPIFLHFYNEGIYLNIDGYFIKGSTPLHMAAIMGLDRIALLYLRHGANVNASDEVGWTPLHLAAKRGNFEVAKLLIKQSADVNVKDNTGITPLMFVAEEGDIETAQLLIKHGADVSARDNDGKAALDYAQEEGHEDLVNLLIKHQKNERE